MRKRPVEEALEYTSELTEDDLHYISKWDVRTRSVY